VNFTESALRNNRVTIIFLAVILASGIMAYTTLPRAEDPGFTIRTALVVTHFPGASPERVEQLVTDKLEEVIQEMPEIDFVTSESRTGVSFIYVNIQPRYKAMRPIWDSLRRKVDRAASDLPDGVIGPYVNDEFGDVFPVMLTVTGDGFTYAELKDAADDVRDEILRLDEVAKVEIYGAQAERIFIEYNNARLAEVGLSPGQLKGILEQRNVIVPGGSIETGPEEIALEPSGNYESIDDLRHTIIRLPGRPEVVYLEDLADVQRGYEDPPTDMMHSGGVPCLGLSVSMREGGNVIDLGDEVRALLPRLRAAYPVGMDFDLVIFQPDFVVAQVNGFVVNLLEAVAIVLGVMLLTLGFRTGVVVSSLIPASMLVTLLAMSILHIGLDQISIAALIIALGMLVDNAIVMSESIMVQIGEGKPRLQATLDSAAELKIPLLVSSLTTAAAFLPIFLAESSTGEYTASLFKVVTIALIASWLLSLTMMPLLCYHFIRVKGAARETSYDTRFYRRYRGFLLAALRHRGLSLAVIGTALVLAMVGMRFVPNVFFPTSDSPRALGEFDLPLGTTIERTNEVVSDIEGFLRRELPADGGHDGFTGWSTYIGSKGGPRYRLSYNPAKAGPEHCSMILSVTSRRFLDRAIPRIEEYCRDHYPELTADIQAEALGPPVESPIQVRISGKDTETLFGIVNRVKTRLADYSGTRNIDDDWGIRSKKLLVNINQARARRAGVTSQDVAISLQAGLTGIETTEYREGSDVIPITLRSVAADRQDVGKLETVNVYSQATGTSVPLSQIADIVVDWEASRVLRRDRLRTVTVKCDLDPGVSASRINAEFIPWLDEASATWPHGIFHELGGEIESSVEANQSIAAKLPIAFGIILLLLVSQFNSVRRTTIVILTIPLALIGVTLGLLLTRAAFGFMTLLGVISLAGIVINNAIVLLDRIRIEIDSNGLEPPRAVVEAAQRRLRPIFLTTATTVGGLLPLWFAGGPMWAPLAISIIFGLSFATVLTLGVVPVLYSIFFRVRFRDFEY